MTTMTTASDERTVETRPAKAKKKGRSPKKRTMAQMHDRHTLYQDAVQCVEAEIDFVDDAFKELKGRRATLIREDFCGTANTSCEWVRRRRTNRAIGVDLDEEVLEWGRENNVGALRGDAKERVDLRLENVLEVETDPIDAVLAMNFSYQIFKDRKVLLTYLKSVRESLADDGVLFMDAYGGYESYKTSREKREIDDDVTYVWDQNQYDPISGEMTCFIHFHFSDGSKMKKAFEYNWRMYTLPEIRDLLEEAGFSKSTVYWEGVDEETGEGDGDFQPTEEAEQDPAWICYIAAEK